MLILPRSRVSRRRRASVIPTQIGLLALLAGQLFATNLALQVSSETAPAGGWAQIKVFSATPQLVLTGRIVMHFDPAVFDTIAAVAVFSAQGDAMGIASVTGQSLDVSISSQSGGIGQLPHLPVLTVTIPVLATAVAGTVSAITLDASQAQWFDMQHNAFSVTVAPGSVKVGGSLSVRNLVPGGGLQPAGALVRIQGAGFTASTAAAIDGASVSNTQFAGPAEIDLTLAGAADLTGKRIVLRNPGGSQVEYFSSIKSVPDLSPSTGFANTQPLLSMQTWTSAGVTFTMRGGAIALQNPNPTAVDVLLQSASPVSELSGQTTVTIPPGALNVYRTPAGEADAFRAFAALPLRVLGMGFAFPQPDQPALYVAAPVPTLPPAQQLTPTPAAVAFQWQAGTAIPAPATVTLYATNLGFSFQVASPGPPFSVTPNQTTAPAYLTIAVNPVGLGAGTYSGNIVLTPEGPNATATTIPLSLTVSVAALLTADPPNLTLIGPSNYGQYLNVASNGNPIAFTSAAIDGATPHWLTINASGGTTPVRLIVTPDSTNLGEGVYKGQIVLTGPANTVTVPAQFSVSASNIFTFSPPSATFSVPGGSGRPPPQTVLVYGPSTGAAFSASTGSGGPWLSVTATTVGQLGAVIAANPAGLKVGSYSGTVTLTSPASSLPARIPVTLVVWDQEPLITVTPPSFTFTLPISGDLNSPAPVSLQVGSGGVPLNFTESGAALLPGVFATPASLPVVAEGNLGALGTYQYNITITGGSQTVVVPVTTIVTTSPLAPPLIGSVANAASQLPGSVAPGEILTIYGLGAGPSNSAGFTLNPSGKVAASLNGAQVLFDGHPAPMIYGSAFQANVIVPYEVSGQPTTTIALQFRGGMSSAWTIPVAASAPGIFTLGSSGLGPAAVLNQDNSINSASNPASRGSIIQVYATGEGQTSPSGVTGSVIGTDVKKPIQTVKVSIGGQDAPVQYAGSAGDSVAGLFQVNVVVPQTVVPGATITISISVGGIPSQSGVTIAVQ